MKKIMVFLVFALTANTGTAFAASTQQGEQQKVEPYRKAGKFSLNSQVTVLTGDYGTGDDITITYVGETLKYIGDMGEIGLTVPYLVRNGGGITAGETALSSTKAIPAHADGIGDVVLKGKYYYSDETDTLPALDLVAKVKFPTADDDKGLGTGKFDAGAGISLMKRFGEVITLLDLGVLGRDRPSSSTIKSTRFDYSVGVGYPVMEKVKAYLFLDGSTKSSSNSDAPLEVVLAGTYKPNKSYSLNSYALAGLTDGSPDFGGSVGVTLYF